MAAIDNIIAFAKDLEPEKGLELISYVQEYILEKKVEHDNYEESVNKRIAFLLERIDAKPLYNTIQPSTHESVTGC